MPRPSKYPEEFRRDAVELVRSSPGRTAGSQWGEQVSAAEREEVRRLRKKLVGDEGLCELHGAQVGTNTVGVAPAAACTSLGPPPHVVRSMTARL